MTGTQVHKITPGEKNLNSIESAWRYVIRSVEKWAASYCGPHPKGKPEGLDRWLRENVAKLPTLEAVQCWVQDFRRAHNARPRKQLGGLSPNLYLERFGGTRRTVDADTIDVYLCPIVAERTCNRDGVTLDGIRFLPEPEDLIHVQGRRVGVRRDPDHADMVTLCDTDGVAICRAYCERLYGVGRDAQKAAESRAKRYKAAARAAYSLRDMRFMPKTSQVLRVQAEFAEAQEAKLRHGLEAERAREVQIIRPDLAESARKCKASDAARDARHQRQKQRATGTDGDAARRAEIQRRADELLAWSPSEREEPQPDLSDSLNWPAWFGESGRTRPRYDLEFDESEQPRRRSFDLEFEEAKQPQAEQQGGTDEVA